MMGYPRQQWDGDDGDDHHDGDNHNNNNRSTSHHHPPSSQPLPVCGVIMLLQLVILGELRMSTRMATLCLPTVVEIGLFFQYTSKKDHLIFNVHEHLFPDLQ
jgi:hypothetical protein